MKKLFKFKVMAMLLAVTMLLGVAPVVSADEVIRIDEKLAADDALLHRQDGIQKAARLSQSAEETTAAEEESEEVAEETEVEVEESEAAKEESKEEETEAAEEAAEKPAVKEYEANNTPNRLTVNFKGDTATSRSFNWYTTEKFESKVLISTNEDMSDAKEFPAMATKKTSHYVERDENGFFIFQLVDAETGEVIRYFTDEGHENDEWDHWSEVTEDNQTVVIDVTEVEEYAYKAEATGLEADTVYFYQVGSEEGGMSEVGTFKTASTEKAAFSFLHYTDTQNAYWNQHIVDEAAFAADTIKKMLALDPEAGFVLHTGDIVEIAEVEDEWVDLFEQSKESFMKTTMAPVAGNHDEYGLSYDERFLYKFTDHFNVPSEGPVDGGTYYSYDYNGVHFVVMNSNDYKNEENKAFGVEQLEWLRWDVKQARANGAEWIILNYHKPLFSKSYHSLQDADVQAVRDDFMKIIDELDIDLALQGHDHVLSRTKALTYVPAEESVFNAVISEEGEDNKFVNPTGTIFLLPNTGGTKTYDDIYSKGLDHVKKVRPKLDWLTEELLEEYNNLFAFGGQPDKSDRFSESHSNFRNSKVQNFAKYFIDGNTITVELYQISGELDEAREPEMVDSFSIEKK